MPAGLVRFRLLELVDFALRVPEPGDVNFNILRVLLRAILKELDIGDRETYAPISYIMARAYRESLPDPQVSLETKPPLFKDKEEELIQEQDKSKVTAIDESATVPAVPSLPKDVLSTSLPEKGVESEVPEKDEFTPIPASDSASEQGRYESEFPEKDEFDTITASHSAPKLPKGVPSKDVTRHSIYDEPISIHFDSDRVKTPPKSPSEGEILSKQAPPRTSRLHTWPTSDGMFSELMSDDKKPETFTTKWKTMNLQNRLSAVEDSTSELTSVMDKTLYEFNSLQSLISELQEKFEQHISESKEKAVELRNTMDTLIEYNKKKEEEKDQHLNEGKSDESEQSGSMEDETSSSEGKHSSSEKSLSEEELDTDLVLSEEEKEAAIGVLPERKMSLSVEESLRREIENLASENVKLESLLNSFIQEINKKIEINKHEDNLTHPKIKQLIKNMNDEVQAVVKLTYEMVENFKSLKLSVEDSQKQLQILKLEKTEREEFYLHVESVKSQLLEISQKVDRDEFQKYFDQLLNILKDLGETVTSNRLVQNELESELSGGTRERRRLTLSLNSLAEQTHEFKKQILKLKRSAKFSESSSVEAAAVTNCLSCGRPAVLPNSSCIVNGRQHYHGNYLTKDGPKYSPRNSGNKADIPCKDFSNLPRKTSSIPSIEKYDVLGLDGTVYKNCTKVVNEVQSVETLDSRLGSESN